MLLVALEGTVGVWVQTRNASDVPTAPDAAPTYGVYEEGASTTVASGTTTGPVNSKTGFYRASISCTSAAGFESGKQYCVLFEYAISSTSYSQLVYFTVA